MQPREQAIADMKYAQSLGETAVRQHFDIWALKTPPFDPKQGDDVYFATLQEVMNKRNTTDCLLVN